MKNKVGKYFSVFSYVMKNELKNNLFFSNLLKECGSNLTYKKIDKIKKISLIL